MPERSVVPTIWALHLRAIHHEKLAARCREVAGALARAAQLTEEEQEFLRDLIEGRITIDMQQAERRSARI